MAVQVPLTRGYVAIVDEVDRDLLPMRWRTLLPSGKPYAVTGSKSMVYLHREIAKRMGLQISGRPVDHINGDGLDNRRINLRSATPAENVRNLGGPNANNTSGLLGVSFMQDRAKWRAQIKVDRKTINLGDFPTKEEAHEARLSAERKMWGIQPRRAELHRCQ